MKRLVIIFFIVVNANVFAQTIKTPTNVSISVINNPEMTPSQLAATEAAAAQWISDHNSQAVRLAPASATYNCHNWAWHQSDGGTAVWINQTVGGGANLSNYWTGANASYAATQSNPTLGNKLFYGASSDHSAVATQTYVNGVRQYESKWGAWPRYRHAVGDCPYTFGGLVHYKIPITGQFLKCVSASQGYSTLNISGATYSWSATRSSISGSGYSVTGTGTSAGPETITVQISSPFSGTTVNGIISTWVGPFNTAYTGVTGQIAGCMGQFYQYVATMPGGAAGGYSYTWTKPATYNWQSGTNAPNVWISIPYQGAQGGTMRVDINNGCGWSGLSGITVYPIPCGGGFAASGESAKAYPNPNSQSTLNVSVDKAGTYEVLFFDSSGNEKKRLHVTATEDKLISIDVTDLKKDNYLVRVSGNGTHSTNRVVIE
jgi:hypothetical protein